jgi:glutaminase
MVNAGALLTANLVDGKGPEAKFERILDGLSAFAGTELHIDTDVSQSEKFLGDRNRALGYLMRSMGTLEEDVDDAISVYARACSVVVTAELLAVMGATLAFGGRNPQTGKQVVPMEVVTTVLSVMATCGMYDGSGRWMRRVGVPAKSGVAGGLVASVPWQMGIGVYSPPLDEEGNSVRGVLACERMSDELGLHMFGGRR